MKITLTGDSLFSSTNLAQRLDPNMLSRLRGSEVNFTNAEFCTPQADTAPAAGRGYVTAVRENRLDELKGLGFNLINFANNHTGDFGIKGILDTITAAEKRNLPPLGIGRSLDEAQLPKFYDAPHGRVSVVAATATRAEVFLASNAGNGIPARPGVNPLRWQQTYIVPQKDFEQLKKIDQRLGLTKSIAVGTKIEHWQPLPDDELFVGSMYQEKLHFKVGNSYQVQTTADQQDLKAILKQISDAKNRSHFTIFSLHTHEGINENWYAAQPADFVKDVAHQAIDAGADIVVGHGAHFLRGIEFYHGCPIFYNLGSFLMEFEAGESLIPPEMYQAYSLPARSLPSQLHRLRAYDHGKLAGFNADEIFSAGVILTVDFDRSSGKKKFYLLPIDLQLAADDALKRGIPTTADEAFARRLIERLAKDSAAFKTDLAYNFETGELNLN